MKNYISVNIVSQSLLLVNIIKKNNCYSIHDVEQLKLPYGVYLDMALDFARQCEWLKETHDRLEFTKTGNEILNLFNGEQIDAKLWKIILGEYISVCCPAWSRRIPYGRLEAFLFMNEEEQRCFIEAGLINSQDEDVLEWWDAFAGAERTRANDALGQIGRRGEKLTMNFEEQRTGVKPDWRSIESNLSGYDILSRRSAVDANRLLIEVKTSSKPINEAEAIISRREWNVANLNNNKQCYLFYFWCLYNIEPRLAVISAEEMSHHIPEDGDFGKWENMSIPFKAFSDKFEKVV